VRSCSSLRFAGDEMSATHALQPIAMPDAPYLQEQCGGPFLGLCLLSSSDRVSSSGSD
jgi:hypothetical protein